MNSSVAEMFDACEKGDVERVREMLVEDPTLARSVAIGRPHRGWTILHDAAQRGRAEIVALLLAHGADPNAREEGDNTCPLHWAAARGDLAIVRALLDAGADVHGFGADHAGDVIGWATLFAEPGTDARAVADFLIARGARHSIFSAMSLGDSDLVRAVVRADPRALGHRLSQFEHRMTPLQLAVVKKRTDLLDLLIELGADLEAQDMHGQTALSGALSLGNHEAARRLQAAGAKLPRTINTAAFDEAIARLSGSIRKIVPMLNVPDVAASLSWYVSAGFTETGRHGDAHGVNWGMVRLGDAEIMLNAHGTKGRQPVSLWLYTSQVDALYALLKGRQIDAARAAVAGQPEPFAIEFVEEIYDPPYGGREFGLRDLNGYELFFLQPAKTGHHE